MKSASIYKLRYKEILGQAKSMMPGYNETVALANFIELQNSIALASTLNAERERAIEALKNKAWAGELYQVFEDRKN